MRGFGIGRKNWLFAGSDKGGERIGNILTIIETAKLHGHNPEVYLTVVLTRIQSHPKDRREDPKSMVNYSNPAFMFIRTSLSYFGVLKTAQKIYRRVAKANYEEKFDTALMNEIRRGDVVWDIGANAGFYTRKFLEVVGATGNVVAFEPSPQSAKRLISAFSEDANVNILCIALSDAEGELDFFTSENSVMDSLAVRSDRVGGQAQKVVVKRADNLQNVVIPTVVKIDVEGFEVEVLRGMAGVLSEKGIRALFIEVHFTQLRERGLAGGANEIVKLLKSYGFKCSWLDPSHLQAKR